MSLIWISNFRFLDNVIPIPSLTCVILYAVVYKFFITLHQLGSQLCWALPHGDQVLKSFEVVDFIPGEISPGGTQLGLHLNYSLIHQVHCWIMFTSHISHAKIVIDGMLHVSNNYWKKLKFSLSLSLSLSLPLSLSLSLFTSATILWLIALDDSI